MPESDNLAELRARVVVVGAGPAGLAAARVAAAAGLDVLLLDAAPLPGGQVWRARQGVAAEPVARALASLAATGVRVLSGTRVVMALPERTLLIDGPDGARRLRWDKLILATGARERLLPFPGWTLPGVFGAGGLQALVKGGWPIRGRRVLVAGTGPLLLAAAATLRREGAQVVGLVEEASAVALARFAGTLAAHPRKALQAMRLGASLLGVPSNVGTRVIAAEGDGRVERVVLQGEGGRPRVVDCDALAAGWGLIPQTELAQSLGCALAMRLGALAIVVDERQRTSVDGVLAVGECTGIAGAVAAQLQGEAAGCAVALDQPARPSRRLAREHAFAAAVAARFPAPADWAARLRDDTLVCRCEDVPWSALRDQPDLRAAKLATRCGMGHCQGRLCHDTLAAVMHWPRLPVRPPLAPAPLATLLAIDQPPSHLET
ncbi:NAD(P)/FAD-dependent oxidoreductase [Scleromatobacter humisilvae]|uniref:NAD(P)/FAD-dependent oxidoreductase n=1 Tax=Scleromatobacter humisilvae TaxID=2897159 RepID=A0A9X1YHJ5_9BURK|nr:FAD/NAD(P)-binding oxidoreductase [Scleromatobacter humisilvae]MCK9686021.1 NAD(P)/FAD-dependent oxidoreductase [Scleromatobacter humisilvae]